MLGFTNMANDNLLIEDFYKQAAKDGPTQQHEDIFSLGLGIHTQATFEEALLKACKLQEARELLEVLCCMDLAFVRPDVPLSSNEEVAFVANTKQSRQAAGLNFGGPKSGVFLAAGSLGFVKVYGSSKDLAGNKRSIERLTLAYQATHQESSDIFQGWNPAWSSAPQRTKLPNSASDVDVILDKSGHCIYYVKAPEAASGSRPASAKRTLAGPSPLEDTKFSAQHQAMQEKLQLAVVRGDVDDVKQVKAEDLGCALLDVKDMFGRNLMSLNFSKITEWPPKEMNKPQESVPAVDVAKRIEICKHLVGKKQTMRIKWLSAVNNNGAPPLHQLAHFASDDMLPLLDWVLSQMTSEDLGLLMRKSNAGYRFYHVIASRGHEAALANSLLKIKELLDEDNRQRRQANEPERDLRQYVFALKGFKHFTEEHRQLLSRVAHETLQMALPLEEAVKPQKSISAA